MSTENKIPLLSDAGFTLIETLVAISLLSIAITAPMSLTSQSLSSAYYARDQITAYNLAQEGLEAVRAVRDGQILLISQSPAAGTSLFGPIPVDQDFTIDSRQSDPVTAISTCAGACPPLETDGTVYGYDPDTSVWVATHFTRVLHACYIQASGACNGTVSDEMRVTVRVSWPTPSMQTRTFTISDNFYRWVNDGVAAQ